MNHLQKYELAKQAAWPALAIAAAIAAVTGVVGGGMSIYEGRKKKEQQQQLLANPESQTPQPLANPEPRLTDQDILGSPAQQPSYKGMWNKPILGQQ